jgi:hypothetical protein
VDFFSRATPSPPGPSLLFRRKEKHKSEGGHPLKGKESTKQLTPFKPYAIQLKKIWDADFRRKPQKNISQGEEI